jgi:AcrR family transcriptional regulator
MKKSALIGRPRKFNRDQSLSNAMRVFWERGYENATLLELQEAMGGMTAPSFYNSFGSKENLFREVVALYAERQGSGIMRVLAEGKTARDSIGAMFEEIVRLVSGADTPKGCLITLGGINCAPGNSEVSLFMQDLRRQRGEVIRARLERGVLEGDLPARTDTRGLADYFITVADGLGLQAKDGASTQSLERTVEFIMSAWDAQVLKSSVG